MLQVFSSVQLRDKRGARMCHLKDFTDLVSVAYLCGCGLGFDGVTDVLRVTDTDSVLG